MVLLIKLMILLSSAAFVVGDLNLKEDHNIDPILTESTKQSAHKRTILFTHNNYALAKHFVYRNGVKYLLGYGQVDLRYMPHFKPVIVRPRFSVIPWHSNHAPLKPVKPSVVPNNDSWKPVVPHKLNNAPQNHQPIQFEPIKLNLPILPYGTMFLTTPIVPQQQLEYYPLPVQTIDPAVYLQNPHVAAAVQPDQSIHQVIVPGGSYEVHGYHQHALKPAYEIQESLQEENHHHYDDDDEQSYGEPYVGGTLEFHGNQQHEHVIQPGQTDVQIPQHLVQHPNYRPEDYYNYLHPAVGGVGAVHYNGHIVEKRRSTVI